MNTLLSMLEGKTVAIVGNGAVDCDASAEIDAAEVVCRFNHFYNYDSQKVGRRVDIIFQTFTSGWYAMRDDVKHIDVIRAQKPIVFIAKKPQQYNDGVRATFGEGVRIECMDRAVDKYKRFTTGGAVLCYLAERLKNAKVKVYGFPQGERWQRYIATQAQHYAHVSQEERERVTAAIKQLESLEVSHPHTHKIQIVVPVKKRSMGCHGKNEILLPHLLEKLKDLKYPVTIISDDPKQAVPDWVLLHVVPEHEGMQDVTKDLRHWYESANITGDVILVQCTSPSFDPDWISQALALKPRANIVASATKIDYKINAIFYTENGRHYEATSFGPPSKPRQLLPQAWRLTGAFFIFPCDYLLNDSLFENAEVTPFFVDEKDALDVDTEKDLKLFLNKAKETQNGI